MKNIIRAQFFQLKRDRLCFIVAFLMAAALLYITWFAWTTSEHNITAGSYFVDSLMMHVMIAIMPTLMLVGQMCCGDFPDKTINSELMGGHKRIESYFGRAIPCILVTVPMALLMIAAPVIFAFFLGGWGSEVSFSAVAVRFLLVGVVLLRLVCEYIMLSFIVKNPYIMMALGYMVFVLQISPIFDGMESHVLAITNLNMLFRIGGWYTYGIENSVNFVYDLYMEPMKIFGTVAVSLIVSAAALIIGYVFFRNDDMN